MPLRRSSHRPLFRADARGSVLVVALLIAALIAVVLGSYLKLNLGSTRLAKRTFHGYAALNLAEAGAEEGVWSFNRASAGETTAWNNWTVASGAARQKFSDFDFGPGVSGWVKVYVDNTTPAPTAQPKIVAQSSVGSGSDTPSTKMLEVTLRRRAFFAGGLVARNRVAFNGANASVDSWDSDPDDSATTAPIPYSASERRDGGSVASVDVVSTAVVVNQANIWGYVATGGGQPQIGANGTVRGASTPANVAVDQRRISTDFNADFNSITAPTDGTFIASVGATLGTAGTATKWRMAGLSLSGNQSLTILGDVTLVFTTGAGSEALSVTGNAIINVPVDSSLTIYTEGDVKIAGKGIGNANIQPISCRLWGTNQTVTGQTFQVAGNGTLSAVVYAPNADVTINGRGDIMGSVVARSITLDGNAVFHFDESLSRYGGNQPFTISKWRELTTSDDRLRYEALFQGW